MEVDVPALSRQRDLLDRVGTLGIDEVDAFHAEDHPGERVVRVCDAEAAQPVFEGVGVDEEQPVVESQDDEPGELLAVGMLVEGEERVRARLPAEFRDLGERRDRDEPDHRDADADEHPFEDPERHHAEQCGHRRQELERLDEEEPLHLADVHHPHDDRFDDDRAEHRLGEIGEHRGQHEQREDDQHRLGQVRHLRSCAGAVVDRALGEAAVVEHPLDEAGRDVRHPLGEQLLVDVDPVVVLGGVLADRRRRDREPDQQQPDRRAQDRSDVVDDQLEVGQGQAREAARYVTDQLHALVVEIEHPGRGDAEEDGDQRARDLRGEDLDAEHQEQRQDADEQGGPIRVGQARHPVPQLLPRVVAGLLGAGDLEQLAGGDVDRDAEREPGQHRRRQELRDPAHPQYPHHDEQQPGDEHDRRRDRDRIVGVRRRQRQHGRAEHRRRRRARTLRHLLRRGEQGERDQPGGRGVQPVLHRDATDRGVPQ